MAIETMVLTDCGSPESFGNATLVTSHDPGVRPFVGDPEFRDALLSLCRLGRTVTLSETTSLADPKTDPGTFAYDTRNEKPLWSSTIEITPPLSLIDAQLVASTIAIGGLRQGPDVFVNSHCDSLAA